MKKNVPMMVAGLVGVVLLVSLVAYYMVCTRHERQHEPERQPALYEADNTKSPAHNDRDIGIQEEVVPDSMPVATVPSRRFGTISLLDNDVVSKQVKAWWEAVKIKDIPSIRELDKQLPILIAADMPARQSLIVDALVGQYSQIPSLSPNSSFQRALLSSLIAKVAVRQYSHMQSTATMPAPAPQSDNELSVKDIVAWSGTALKDMADNLLLDVVSKQYLIEVLPATLSMLCHYSEDMAESTSGLTVFEHSQDGLLKLPATDVERQELQKMLQQYHADLKTIVDNGHQMRNIRKLLDSYVTAYNAKDTDALLKVFLADSSAATKLKAADAKRLISVDKWTIQSLTVKHIYVNGEQASVDVIAAYATQTGLVGKSISASFVARRINNENEWRLE